MMLLVIRCRLETKGTEESPVIDCTELPKASERADALLCGPKYGVFGELRKTLLCLEFLSAILQRTDGLTEVVPRLNPGPLFPCFHNLDNFC